MASYKPASSGNLVTACRRPDVDARLSATPTPKKRRSDFFCKNGKSQKRKADENKPTQVPHAVRLARRHSRQTPTAKSPMFMSTSSSIYAAVCKYDSLFDALHGISDDGDSNGCPGSGASGGSRSVDVEMERSLIVAHVHFGECSIFKREFASFLSNESSLSPCTVEQALTHSVRHLCDCECFRRAYCAIREFASLWRDVTVDESDGTTPVSPARRHLTKENIFSGWGCKILPPVPVACGSMPLRKRRQKADVGPSPTVVFVSPDGVNLNTKTKAIKFMNRSLSSLRHLPGSTAPLRRESLPRLKLIDSTTIINPLYSPLGLLEELFLYDPWKLLVSTICLNVTTRVQVDRTLHRFLQRWPNAKTTAQANWEEISKLISPLGLGVKRAKGLIRFSKEYLALVEDLDLDAFGLTEKQVRGLYNVGRYGWTAYEVFILKRLPAGSVKVCDHALQLYVEYQLGRQACEAQKMKTFG